MGYSKTIVACDLKLIDLMKICEYWRSRSFLDLGAMSFIDEDLTCFSQKPHPIFNQILNESLWVKVNENPSTYCRSYDQDMATLSGKPL